MQEWRLITLPSRRAGRGVAHIQFLPEPPNSFARSLALAPRTQIQWATHSIFLMSMPSCTISHSGDISRNLSTCLTCTQDTVV